MRESEGAPKWKRGVIKDISIVSNVLVLKDDLNQTGLNANAYSLWVACTQVLIVFFYAYMPWVWFSLEGFICCCFAFTCLPSKFKEKRQDNKDKILSLRTRGGHHKGELVWQIKTNKDLG